MSYLAIKIGAWAITGLAAFVLLWDASVPPERKLQPGEQITTVLNSVVPPTIALTPIATTTTAVPKGCAQYVADAISAGWPADQAPTLARVMFRESRCVSTAFNPRDTNGGSYGLMQINGFWCTPSAYWPQGWLQAKGILTVCDSLFDPKVNLIAGLAVWHNSNWKPWNLPK
jgi:hypothetical protein